MAERNYKLNESIEIVYQAPNAAPGLDIRADVYDQNKAIKFVDISLAEVGGTGTYRNSFTPDAVGEWQAIIYEFVDSATRNGQVVKRYSVGAHNVNSVGVAAEAVKVKTDNLPAAPASEGNVTAVGGQIVTSEGNIRGGPDTLKTISDQLDGIEGSVGSLDTPPMVS